MNYTHVMIDAGIVGLGWWGKNLIEAVQGKSDRLRFVRGACRDTRPVATFAERHGLALSSSLTDHDEPDGHGNQAVAHDPLPRRVAEPFP